MKGLALSRLYYEEYGYQLFSDKFPEIMQRAAVGMVGPGSDCFGFDDTFSRDHDWGPAFCIWLADEDWQKYGQEMNALYGSLSGEWRGYPARQNSQGEAGRVGVMASSIFYRRYTGKEKIPITLQEWDIPENYLALATNGQVFVDNLGEFTAWRQALLAYYPEDIRRKKIADCCMKIGQAGQYNWQRALQRGDSFVMMESKQQFCREVLQLLFLLNRRYAPYFKWLFRGGQELPILGKEVCQQLKQFLASNDELQGIWQGQQDLLMDIVGQLVDEMVLQKIIANKNLMLVDHVPAILQTIKDDEYRRMQWGGV